MWLAWLKLFGIFAFNLTVLTGIIYWSTLKAETLAVFGMRFRNIHTFWAGFILCLLPVYAAINYCFYYAYWYGYKKVFPLQMWRVIETQWLASLLVTLLMTWLFFHELPTKNGVVAIFFLFGALVAIVWK